MISPVSTLLVAAHALVTISTAQAVGKFVHEASYFTATYDVNEERQAMLTIVLKNWRNKNGQVFEFRGPHKFTSRFFPLRELDYSIYTVDSRKAGHTDDSNGLDESIRDALVFSGATDGYPLGPEDFTTIKYSTADTFTTTFGSSKVLAFTRNAYDLVPGNFVYKDTAAPHHEITYTIRDGGILGIKVKCGKYRESSGPLKLLPRYHDQRRVRYEVESTRRKNLDRFLYRARRICPSKFSTPAALSQVVFATQKTIFVPFEGGTLVLTKV
ncbi:hypothetical protein FOZ60_014078 [Perkinsus olseni]|uniref:Uncharacterized protein n=1 Tax=Perkinsus olseni TaxID=32597 RepID=A0A7J6P7J4_PEROL|nr:hypothetical protein FOZ60_014078 [Perkinsus olseni]